MNRSTTDSPLSTGTVITRAAAVIGSLTLAAALTSCSFSFGELQPVGEEESSAAPVEEPDPAEQAEESPAEDAPAPDTAPDSGGGFPVDPAQAQVWAEDVFWLSGSGEAFYRLDWTPSSSTVMELTHSGSSNFIIVTYGTNGERYASIVNEIGAYEGSSALADLPLLDGPEAVDYLHIQADGPWTLAR